MTEFTLEESIAAPPEEVFARASDFPSMAETIQGIERVEMLTPGPVRVGTRFRETRILFKREATEEMEVLELDPPRRYVLRAESHGTRYESELSFHPQGDGTLLRMRFQAQPLTLVSKILTVMFWPLAKVAKREMARDLTDLKAAIEGGAGRQPAPAP